MRACRRHWWTLSRQWKHCADQRLVPAATGDPYETWIMVNAGVENEGNDVGEGRVREREGDKESGMEVKAEIGEEIRK